MFLPLSPEPFYLSLSCGVFFPGQAAMSTTLTFWHIIIPCGDAPFYRVYFAGIFSLRCYMRVFDCSFGVEISCWMFRPVFAS
jgi:hypothetical protein